jgi:hypothetical protein
MSAATDLLLWQSLDTELVSMLDTFSNLVKASHVPDEESEPSAFNTRERKAPGDMLEVCMSPPCCCYIVSDT